MIRLPRRRPTKALTSFLYVLASFSIVVLITGSIDTALATDKPKSTDPQASQTGELEIPGSFKVLSDAKDAVTAKRSPEEIPASVVSNAGSVALEIDAEKAAARGGVRTEKAVVRVGAKTERAAERATAGGAAKTILIPYIDSDLVDFDATAYCLKGRTASGMDAKPGMIAADPRVLPLGTIVHLRSGSYTGTYRVMDTGGRIRGRRVDVYVASHKEAVQFGRRQVKIKILGHNSSKSPVAAEQ
ncbi:MAG TPA: 3D domain-containing protein [Blastocatellia bacterium]|nr:3D domain-containing protein [Blastocatellia bacterium]